MKRILIVDDAATVRMYYRGILEAGGYVVDQAINGVEALECALRYPYSLFVVDVNMPTLDGYGFLRELRRQDMPRVPAIMISSEAKQSDRDLAYAAGADLYLVKPSRPQQLLLNVQLLIGAADAP